MDQDQAAINLQKTIEGGGSGIVENLTHEKNISGNDAIIELAGTKLQKYAQQSTTLKFKTEESGLAPGQLLEIQGFENLFIDNGEELLISRVEMYDISGHIIMYDVEACKGPAQSSWGSFFRQIDKLARPEIRLGMVDTSSVISPEIFEKTWVLADVTNPFEPVTPSTLLTPSTTLCPCLPYPEPIEYCAVYDTGVEIGRVPIAQISGVGGETITTIAYFSTTDGNGTIDHIGWIGGQHTTSAADSGEILDYQAWDHTKTSSECLLIKKYDYKGW